MSLELLNRLRTMDGAELRFRAKAVVRRRVGRARAALAPESWRRETLRLTPGAPPDAIAALRRGNWTAAHAALASHFAGRPTAFVLDPRRLGDLAREVSNRFPRSQTTERADRLLAGRYDLLGYRDVYVASPPDWQRDPVHERRAPVCYWDSVPFLDPACGDHKIIWELNRHQHFLVLGAAHAKTGDGRYYDEFVSQLSDWIRYNPPLAGINWASMLELAFRCLSWTWALHFFAGAASHRDEQPWIVDLLLALERQLVHVEQNLSHYFSPNTHLTGEALALYVVGRALPELASAEAFATTGRQVLIGEARRQVLPDGGHAERSAHYHRYSTDFYLLALHVARVTRDPAETIFDECARRQATFLRALADDSGRLPLLGDDDGGQLFSVEGTSPDSAAATLASAAALLADDALAVGPAPEDAWWFCGGSLRLQSGSSRHVPPGSVAFRHSGYYVCRGERGDHLVFDAGPHGYLNGGHAHADALSIVVTAAGRPLLIDPGTATYTMDPAARDRFRSTAMHNTVVVDGRSQSVPRGPFHWQSRADAVCTAWHADSVCDYVEGYHLGYAPVVHLRSIAAIPGTGWIIVDHLVGGTTPVAAAAMWHVHPAWETVSIGSEVVRLRHADGTEAALASSAPLRHVTWSGLDEYAPMYGRIEPALCFSTDVGARTLCTFVTTRPSSASPRVSELDIEASRGDLPQAAFRIDMGTGALIVLASAELERSAVERPSGAERSWGTQDVRTTGRFALFRLTDGGVQELCTIPRLAPSMQTPNSSTDPGT